MSIFGKTFNKKDSNTKFVGAHVPLLLNAYINLYAIGTGTSKSALLLELFTKWFEENQKENSPFAVAFLVDTIVQKGVTAYKTLKTKGNFSSSKFYTELSQELTVKGINSESIKLIITRIKNDTK